MTVLDHPLDHAIAVVGNRLFVEGHDAEEIASAYGTPLFVLSERQIRRNYRRFRDALAAAWPGADVLVMPSVKANYLLAVRRILAQEGAGCDTFGPGELWSAARSGVPGSRISVNGTGKSRSLIRDAIGYGARLTIDSAEEAEVVCEEARRVDRVADVRIRIRPDASSLTSESEFTADGTQVAELAQRYKPGVPRDQVNEVGEHLLRSPEVRLTGLMAHLGRHRADLAYWEAVVEVMAADFVSLCRAWNWVPSSLDIGGGFASLRDPTARLLEGQQSRLPAPTIEAYCRTVASVLSRELAKGGVDASKITLEIEPGRSLLTDTGIHLTRVSNVKEERVPSARRWIETDTTEMFLTDGVMEHNRFTVVSAGEVSAERSTTADIVGMSCQFDIIVPDARLPTVSRGDVLAILDAGAYLEGSATNFNALPRPGTVLVSSSGCDLVKRAETVEDVFARDQVPVRLLAGAGHAQSKLNDSLAH